MIVGRIEAEADDNPGCGHEDHEDPQTEGDPAVDTFQVVTDFAQVGEVLMEFAGQLLLEFFQTHRAA